MLDSAGYDLQVNKGEGGKEIDLPNGRGKDKSRIKIVNVTIKNILIVDFSRGIECVNTNNNAIISNYIADCGKGINRAGSPKNVFIQNNMIVNNS